MPQKVYRLWDDFSVALAAGSVNGSPATYPSTVRIAGPVVTRSIVDTENKLSIANGALTYAGGKAAPAYGDPGSWHPAWTRAAGLVLTMRLLDTDVLIDFQRKFPSSPAWSSWN